MTVRFESFLQRIVHISLHHKIVSDTLKSDKRIVQFWINSQGIMSDVNLFPTIMSDIKTSSQNHSRYDSFPYISISYMIHAITELCRLWITSSQNFVRYRSFHQTIISVMNHFIIESCVSDTNQFITDFC